MARALAHSLHGTIAVYNERSIRFSSVAAIVANAGCEFRNNTAGFIHINNRTAPHQPPGFPNLMTILTVRVHVATLLGF